MSFEDVVQEGVLKVAKDRFPVTSAKMGANGGFVGDFDVDGASPRLLFETYKIGIEDMD